MVIEMFITAKYTVNPEQDASPQKKMLKQMQARTYKFKLRKVSKNSKILVFQLEFNVLIGNKSKKHCGSDQFEYALISCYLLLSLIISFTLFSLVISYYLFFFSFLKLAELEATTFRMKVIRDDIFHRSHEVDDTLFKNFSHKEYFFKAATEKHKMGWMDAVTKLIKHYH